MRIRIIVLYISSTLFIINECVNVEYQLKDFFLFCSCYLGSAIAASWHHVRQKESYSMCVLSAGSFICAAHNSLFVVTNPLC